MNKPPLYPEPAPLALYYSKPKAWAVLIAIVAGAGYMLFHMIVLGAALALLPIFLLLAFLFLSPFVPILPESLGAIRHAGPVLVLDSRGITDVRERNSFASWDSIARVYLGRGGVKRRSLVLCVQFRDAETAKAYLPRPAGPVMLWNRFHGVADWNLALRPLRCSPKEVEAVAIAFHRWSVARKARSADAPAGAPRATK